MLSRLVVVVVVDGIVHWRSRLYIGGRLTVELENVADVKAGRTLGIFINPEKVNTNRKY